MNSVKYNNWREAVQNHQHAVSGFDREAVWEKLNPPKTSRRKRTLIWLAAACMVTILFVAALQWNGKTIDASPGIGKKPGNEIHGNPPVKEAKEDSAAVQNQQQPYISGKENIEPIANDRTSGKNAHAKTPEQAYPANPEPMIGYPEETAFAVVDTPAAKAIIPVVVETKNNTAANVLKIVHINELINQNAGISQTVQGERKPSRIPFSKPAYTQYAAEQEPPPAQTERKRFGLLKTVASLKEN
jgi:hypothetical protein